MPSRRKACRGHRLAGSGPGLRAECHRLGIPAIEREGHLGDVAVGVPGLRLHQVELAEGGRRVEGDLPPLPELADDVREIARRVRAEVPSVATILDGAATALDTAARIMAARSELLALVNCVPGTVRRVTRR